MITYDLVDGSTDTKKLHTFVADTFNSLASIALLPLEATHVLTYSAMDEEKIVGIFQLSWVLDEAEIILIAVDPAYRRQGIAKKFLTQFLRQQDKIRDIFLEVSCKNDIAISFYQALGFRQVGLRKKYYENRLSKEREDALVMKMSWREKSTKD